MSDEFSALRKVIATQAMSDNPAKRAGSLLMEGALDSLIEFKRLTDADPASDAAADLAVGLVDAMGMIMASLLTRLESPSAIALAGRLADAIGHVIRTKSQMGDEPLEGNDDGRRTRELPTRDDATVRGRDDRFRGPPRASRRKNKRDFSH